VLLVPAGSGVTGRRENVEWVVFAEGGVHPPQMPRGSSGSPGINARAIRPIRENMSACKTDMPLVTTSPMLVLPCPSGLRRQMLRVR
jgi:hypothetical protein